jgi:proton glutamate symport protein
MTDSDVTVPDGRSHRYILGALLAAVCVGILLRFIGEDAGALLQGFRDVVLGTCDIVGRLFLRLLKMVIVPLVFGSVAMAIIGIDPRHLGRLGLWTVLFFLGTTAIAATLGLGAVLLTQPGANVTPPACATADDCPARFACDQGRCIPDGVQPPAVSDIFLTIVPDNPVASMAAKFDLPGVIFFAIVLALGVLYSGEAGAPLRRFLDSLTTVMNLVTSWVMRGAPVGIFGLVVKVVHSTGLDALYSVGTYALTVVGALLTHGLLILPLLVLALGRTNPLRVIAGASPALLTAFSTASSSATLPLTRDCTEHRIGVAPHITNFVLPLGATVNMNGTALYEAVAALFIAQAYGIDLTAGQQAIVVLTSILAAVGAAGIPSAGLVTLIIVLNAVGLPLEGIALLLTVDRLLDMVRTTVNVWGDVCGAVIVDEREKRRLSGSV